MNMQKIWGFGKKKEVWNLRSLIVPLTGYIMYALNHELTSNIDPYLPKLGEVKDFFILTESHRKSRPGCPQTFYLAYIQHTLGYDEKEMAAEEIVTLAKDQCAWRKLAIACSAAEG